MFHNDKNQKRQEYPLGYVGANMSTSLRSLHIEHFDDEASEPIRPKRHESAFKRGASREPSDIFAASSFPETISRESLLVFLNDVVTSVPGYTRQAFGHAIIEALTNCKWLNPDAIEETEQKARDAYALATAYLELARNEPPDYYGLIETVRSLVDAKLDPPASLLAISELGGSGGYRLDEKRAELLALLEYRCLDLQLVEALPLIDAQMEAIARNLDRSNATLDRILAEAV
jgi:hypothetical protein